MTFAGRHFSWLSLLCCGILAVGVAFAVGFGFGVAPWLIVGGAFCVLMMGSMLWMMVGMGVHTAHRVGQSGSDRREEPVNEDIPVEILDRRLAEGAISTDDYRARRAILANDTAEPNGAADELLTTSGARDGRER